MLTRIASLLIVFLFAGVTIALPASAQSIRFAGDGSEQTDVFDMDGPWLLDWNTRTPSKLPCNYEPGTGDGTPGVPCNFELRLFDAGSGNFVGTIAQLEGEGRGHQLFERAGSYRIDVVAQHLRWELLVVPIDEARAAELKERSGKGPTLEERAMAAARQVSRDSFVSWRPVDDATLLLFAEGDLTGYRVTFATPCPGLAEATALSFVTSFSTDDRLYDSILLDDGTRCYFDRVIPTVMD